MANEFVSSDKLNGCTKKTNRLYAGQVFLLTAHLNSLMCEIYILGWLMGLEPTTTGITIRLLWLCINLI